MPAASNRSTAPGRRVSNVQRLGESTYGPKLAPAAQPGPRRVVPANTPTDRRCVVCEQVRPRPGPGRRVEKDQPRLPSPLLGHRKQARIMLLPRGFEISTQIKQRRRQDAALDEQQRDEKSADSAVTVQERRDRLELCMRETGMNERLLRPPRGEIALSRPGIPLTRPATGHIARIVQSASGWPDPVLAAPEFPRRALCRHAGPA